MVFRLIRSILYSSLSLLAISANDVGIALFGEFKKGVEALPKKPDPRRLYAVPLIDLEMLNLSNPLYLNYSTGVIPIKDHLQYPPLINITNASTDQLANSAPLFLVEANVTMQVPSLPTPQFRLPHNLDLSKQVPIPTDLLNLDSVKLPDLVDGGNLGNLLVSPNDIRISPRVEDRAKDFFSTLKSSDQHSLVDATLESSKLLQAGQFQPQFLPFPSNNQQRDVDGTFKMENARGLSELLFENEMSIAIEQPLLGSDKGLSPSGLDSEFASVVTSEPLINSSSLIPNHIPNLNPTLTKLLGVDQLISNLTLLHNLPWSTPNVEMDLTTALRQMIVAANGASDIVSSIGHNLTAIAESIKHKIHNKLSELPKELTAASDQLQAAFESMGSEFAIMSEHIKSIGSELFEVNDITVPLVSNLLHLNHTAGHRKLLTYGPRDAERIPADTMHVRDWLKNETARLFREMNEAAAQLAKTTPPPPEQYAVAPLELLAPQLSTNLRRARD